MTKIPPFIKQTIVSKGKVQPLHELSSITLLNDYYCYLDDKLMIIYMDKGHVHTNGVTITKDESRL